MSITNATVPTHMAPIYVKLDNGFYLVTSQLAYNQLLQDRFPAEAAVDLPTDYPKTFPAVLKIYRRYLNRNGLSCEWQSLKEYREKLERQLQEIEGM